MKLKPLVSLLAAAFAAPAVLASTSGVVISQVYGGHGNVFKNDYVELFNGGSAAVSLAGWSVQYASATGTGNFVPVPLNGTLQPGQYYLVKLATTSANGADLPNPDATGTLDMSGTNGKVILANVATTVGCNGGSTPCNATQTAQIVDLLGYGTANYFEGTASTAATSTMALYRAANGCTDTDNNSSDFARGTPVPRNTASTLNVCSGGTPINQPIVTSCADKTVVGGTLASVSVSATDADSRVNAVSVVGSLPEGVSLAGFTAASGDGVAATQVIEVASTVAAGSLNVSLKWDNDEAQTASCSFKINVSGAVSIPAIQGTGAKSPMEGASVITSGVVTKVHSNGFYLQDPVGDGNPATSDAIFVFTSTAPTVTVGQKIQLSGTVAEFNTGAASNAQTLANTVTQITGPSSITSLGSGFGIAPVVVDLATLPADGLEAYEGMLVTLQGPLMVQQNFFLGRFGQLTMAAGDRVNTPTNVHRPGASALALKAENARRSFLLDDGSSAQNVNPTPYIGLDNTVRAGDTTTSITGVVDYGITTTSNTGPALYKIHPVSAPSFDRTNPRLATPQVSGGNVRIASVNVLNFFTSFVDGGFVVGSAGCSLGASVSNSNCRGANNLTEFNRQLDKTLAELKALNADVVGLMEIQNNGNTTVDYLVSKLNLAMGAGTYATVTAPAQGTGTDAIRVAMIYKPGKLALSGASISDPAAINNRPPFAQGFLTPNGSKFAVVVNHLKSKGSCPSAGDADFAGNADDGLQGCWNALRVEQATQLKGFLSQVQSVAGTADVVLLGDFNAYAKEDPIDALTGDGGIVDAVGAIDPLDWSYVFDGASGRLDHGFVTASLAPKVTSASSWHINADEPSFIDYNTEFKVFGSSTTGSPDYYTPTPFRSSDHDPMVLGLSLVKTLNGTSGRDVIVGTAGDDVITGGLGADTLTGNGGRNQFVYNSLVEAGDTITDFVPGTDTLVLTNLLASLGANSANPLASGHVSCSMVGANAIVHVDGDGFAGPQGRRALVQLRGVNCAALTASSFKF